jgi:hypothetical protein
MGAVRFVRNTPCATLLVVQLVGVLAYPFMEETVAGRSVLAVFGLLVLALVVMAVRATPTLWWVAVTLAVPAIGLLVVQAVTNSSALSPWSAGFESALYFYAAYTMLVYMLADADVTTDEYFAIGAVFTLLAWAFAYLYVVVQSLAPGSFIADANPGEPRSWTELLYLSFTTLSSTGLSDVMPVRGHARSVVMIEQLAGVFYIAMVVTRLVGLSGRRARRTPTP